MQCPPGDVREKYIKTLEYEVQAILVLHKNKLAVQWIVFQLELSHQFEW